MKKICEYCKNEFNGRKSAKCCSRECSDKKRKEDTLKKNSKKCEVCNVEFIPKRESAKYCSKKCMGISKQLKPKKCLNCGNKFKPYKSFLKFCSVKCSGEYHSGELNGRYSEKIKYKCVICGKEFFYHPHTEGRKKCCSKECRVKYTKMNISGSKSYMWKGGTRRDYRGENWQEQRKKALERDKYRCVDCGITNEESKKIFKASLSIHHIKPFRLFSNYIEANSLDNLESLCNICHMRKERKIQQVNTEVTL
ncbi:hypothetical protein UT300003_07790 [Clostridium sardiniense]